MVQNKTIWFFLFFVLYLQMVECNIFDMKKYIGNIIVSNLNYKSEEYFKKCKTLDEIDNEVPTLIIGLDNAKKNITDFNILKRQYSDNMLWWTFSKNERRVDHDKDIVDFQNFCIGKMIGKINYKYVNYVDLNYGKAKKIINYLLGNKKKCYYVDNNKFIFLYDKENTHNSKNIYGFSLNTLAFFGISREKIVNLFKKGKNNLQIKNFYSIPRTIRNLVNDDIPSKMVLFEYF